jgi:hypothetical protein
MESDVNIDNALDLFSIAPTLLGDAEFGLSFIEENVEKIFEKDSFVRLPKDRLLVLLKSDKLQCDEMTVFKAVQRWAKEQEKKEGFDKKSIADVIGQIRFPTMEVADLSVVAAANLVDPQHLVSLFSYVAMPEAARGSVPAPPYPIAPRTGAGWQWDPVKKGGSVTLSNKNLTAATTGSSWRRGLVMGSKAFANGNQYWEIKIENSQNDMIGVVAPDVRFDTDSIYSNQTSHCWFVHHPGSLYGCARGTRGGYSGAIRTGDTVGIGLVWDEKTSTFSMDVYVNRVKMGTPFTRIPPPVCAATELYASPARVTLNTRAKKP